MKSKWILFLVFISIGLASGCSGSDVVEEPVPAPSEPKANGKDTTSDSVENISPSLLSVTFRCEDNAYQLSEDIACEILDDSVVVCRIPNVVENKQLKPAIRFVGEKLLIDGVAYQAGDQYDFRKPVKLSVIAGHETRTYTVYVHSFTGLPVMWIETVGRQDITSKEEYLKASFRLEEGVVSRGAGDVICDSIQIKGRGNTTWSLFDKKPYRLKFGKKVSLLDMPADKAWVLLANPADKSMLRNMISFYLGQLSNLDWTPRAHFVELMLNGRYNGTYLLTEKIKISEHRVNIGDNGILMELDAYAHNEADSRYFNTNHFKHEINIKAPHVEYGDEIFNKAKNLMLTAEEVLFSDDFTDPLMGWRKYLDETSFIDWYLVNEIVKNTDVVDWSSTYFNCQAGGKLKMGPLWDFDLTFGNCEEKFESQISTPEGFSAMHNPWISQLFKDSSFVKNVKARYEYFYSQKERIFMEINENSQYLKYAVVENDNRWHTLYASAWRNPIIWGSYDNEVQFLKQWLNTRMEWLKREYENM